MRNQRDQAEGLRRMFDVRSITLAIAAKETEVVDAYALIKRVAHEQGCGRFRIAITHAQSQDQAQAIFDSIERLARERLDVQLEYLGHA
ncbi:MAG: hypothetical protein Q8O31_01605 [Rhodocyclaceae bacterium]|nr:hypothetical protein [Rhodocyclaceae bacterium]